MYRILHIDTSGEKAIVAVSEDGQMLSLRSSDDTRNHASNLNSMVDDCLESCGIILEKLNAVAVIGGPGSYTGLRIGLATAKAYCYALTIPLLMHNRLDLLALQAVAEGDKPVLAVLPAREKEYFACLYAASGECIIQPKHIEEEELVSLIQTQKCRVLGVLSKTIEGIVTASHAEVIDIQIVDSDFWAKKAFDDANCNSFVNLFSSEPFYLKHVHTHKPR